MKSKINVFGSANWGLRETLLLAGVLLFAIFFPAPVDAGHRDGHDYNPANDPSYGVPCPNIYDTSGYSQSSYSTGYSQSSYGYSQGSYKGGCGSGKGQSPCPPYSQGSYYGQSPYYGQTAYYGQSGYYTQTAYYAQTAYYVQTAYYAQTSYYVQAAYITPADIDALPKLVRKGSETTVTWDGGNASSCTVTGGDHTFSGVTGSEAVVIDNETTFTLNCILGPRQSSDSVTVRVIPEVEET